MSKFMRALASAESKWEGGNMEGCLAQYDIALRIARRKKDRDKEGMVLAGKGCALCTTGVACQLQEGLNCYAVARAIAVERGNATQARFVDGLIATATDDLKCLSDSTKAEHGDDEEAAGVADSQRESSGSTLRQSIDSTLSEAASRPSSPESTGTAISNASSSDGPRSRALLDLLMTGLRPVPKFQTMAVWELTYDLLRQILLATTEGQVENLTLSSQHTTFSAEDAKSLSHTVAELLQLRPEDVCTKLSKRRKTKNASDTVAAVFVHTKILVSKIHSVFDTESTGVLGRKQCQEFLNAVRMMPADDYERFATGIGADPRIGINSRRLMKFYRKQSRAALEEEFELLMAKRAQSIDKESLKSLTVRDMVSRLFQEYDNDGDGFLNHIEFSGMINDLIDLSEKHYEEICEKVKVSVSEGLDVAATVRWYSLEACTAQLIMDYERVVLMLPPTAAAATTEAAPAQADTSSAATNLNQTSLVLPVADHICDMMKSGRYSECVAFIDCELQGDSCRLASAHSGNAASSSPAAQCRQNQHEEGAAECNVVRGDVAAALNTPDEKCRRAYLRLTRGHAHFKLEEWDKALADFQAAMKAGGADGGGQYRHPNLLRRVRMCKRHCHAPPTTNSVVVELDTSSVAKPDTRSVVEPKHTDPYDDFTLSVEQLLEEFKQEDRMRAGVAQPQQ